MPTAAGAVADIVSTGNQGLAAAGNISSLFGFNLAQTLGITTGADSSTQPNASGFSISTFKSAVNSYGVIRSNMFSIQFSIPSILSGVYSTRTSQTAALYCDGSSFPAVGMDTIDGYKRYGVGQAEKIPLMPVFTDHTFSFMLDGYGVIDHFFSDWMNSISSFNVSKGVVTQNNVGLLPYEVSYKNDYVVQLHIYAYDTNLNMLIEYVLRDAFPISKSPVPFNWSDDNSIARLPVSFAFTDWYTNKQVSILQGGTSSGLSTFGLLQKGASIVELMSTLKAPQNIGDIVNLTNNASIIKNNIQ